ncbi:unnamed protein product [Lathyrus sativus]|nr:unnamed protein product [Lathyrus sativus]
MNTDSDSESDVRSITDSDVLHEIDNFIHRAEVQAYTYVLHAFIYKANDIDQEKQDLIISLISELKISKDEHNEVLAEIKDDEMIHLVRINHCPVYLQCNLCRILLWNLQKQHLKVH